MSATTVDDEGMDKTTTYSWGQSLSTELGLFFDLPQSYTLEVMLNNYNLLNFNSFAVQVIVPLDDANWFSKDSETSK